MAKLDAATRAKLPNTAFAYVDARGRRLLPIHDEAHVRNALARFRQVRFDDDQARERARKRLLNAAKKYSIVPVGFIAGQFESEREIGQRGASAPAALPSGFVTLLMTDVERSTELVHQLGDGYRELIDGVWTILTETAVDRGGHVVERRADEFFAVFEGPGAAVDMAVAAQRQIRTQTWADGLEVRVRIGIHSGYPTVNKANYIGLAVHTAARVCAAGHGGQIVVSGDTREALQGATPEGVRFRRLGSYSLRGLPAPVTLFQVAARGLPARFPELRAASTATSVT